MRASKENQDKTAHNNAAWSFFPGINTKVAARMASSSLLFATMLLLLVATALAQVQSHRLSEIRDIDTDLDLNVYQLNASRVNGTYGDYTGNVTVADSLRIKGGPASVFGIDLPFAVGDGSQFAGGWFNASTYGLMALVDNASVIAANSGFGMYSSNTLDDTEGQVQGYLAFWDDGGKDGWAAVRGKHTKGAGGSGASVQGFLANGSMAVYGDEGDGEWAGFFLGDVSVKNGSDDAELCLNGDCRSAWPSGGGGGGLEGAGASGRLAIWNGTDQLNSTAGLVWDFDNGRLGIGVGAPQKTLHVRNGGSNLTFGSDSRLTVRSDSGQAIMTVDRGSTIAAGDVEFNTQGANKWSVGQMNSDSDLRFYSHSGAGQTLFLDAVSGRIGIGTTTPDAMLDIEMSSGGAIEFGSSDNTATGEFALAGGMLSNASGEHSFAFGNDAVASNDTSIAMGRHPLSAGQDSVALGAYADALGLRTVSIGYSTISNGTYSLAMGDYSISSGYVSTSLGRWTRAMGDHSIAMGLFSRASGNHSVAIGEDIEAAGNHSFAIALDDMSGTVVSQDNTMAIMGGDVGIGTASPDVRLDVEVESGGSAELGHSSNSATGEFSVAAGNMSNASGDYSVALGYNSSASFFSSFAAGANTVSSGPWAAAFGLNTVSASTATFASGNDCVANGTVSTATGYGTIASGRYSFTTGYGIEARGDYTVGIALADESGTVITDDNVMSIIGGKVGINTTSPDATLHVSSVIKSEPTDSPGTCDSNMEGGMYYDASLNKPCYCDGSDWQQFDGGGTC